MNVKRAVRAEVVIKFLHRLGIKGPVKTVDELFLNYCNNARHVETFDFGIFAGDLQTR